MSNPFQLDEPADLNAEVGSVLWSRAVAREIWLEAQKLDADVDSLQEWISIAAKHEAWKVLGYVSLDVFLIAEANFTQSIIDAIRNAKGGTVGDAIKVAKNNPLPAHGGDRKSDQNQVDNINLKTKGGTDTEYTLRRLARDNPELLDAIERGDLSVNQAAIKAGIRKKLSQAEICVKAFRKAENRLEALRLIASELEPHEAAVLSEWLLERVEA
jgi:hypothetical protein